MEFLTYKNLQGEGRLQRSLGLYRFGFGCHCCCSSSDFLVAGRLDQGQRVNQPESYGKWLGPGPRKNPGPMPSFFSGWMEKDTKAFPGF